MVQFSDGFLTLAEAFDQFCVRLGFNRTDAFLSSEATIQRKELAQELGDFFKRGELLLWLRNTNTDAMNRLPRREWPETKWCCPLVLHTRVIAPVRPGENKEWYRYNDLQPCVREAEFTTWLHAQWRGDGQSLAAAQAGGGTASVVDVESRPDKTVTKELLEAAYNEYVTAVSAKGSTSSADEDWDHLRKMFPVSGVTLKRVRQLRKEFAPPAWQQPGRKRLRK